MLLVFPRSYQLDTLADKLVAVFEAYSAEGPGLPLIDRCVVKKARLVSLLTNGYLLTVKWKHDDYAR